MSIWRLQGWMIVLLVAIAVDLGTPIVLVTDCPGYRHLRDTISELGTARSPVRHYQRLLLVAVGGMILAYAFGQALSFSAIRWGHALLLLGIFLFGVGNLRAGLFPRIRSALRKQFRGRSME